MTTVLLNACKCLFILKCLRLHSLSKSTFFCYKTRRPIIVFTTALDIILHSRLYLGFFFYPLPCGFVSKMYAFVISPMLATYPAHLIKVRTTGSILYSFPGFLFISFFLCRNIFLGSLVRLCQVNTRVVAFIKLTFSLLLSQCRRYKFLIDRQRNQIGTGLVGMQWSRLLRHQLLHCILS